MKLSRLTRFATYLIILAFSAFAIVFILNFSVYAEAHLNGAGLSISRGAVCAIGIALCIPCILVLLLALPLSDAIKNDTVFTEKTSKRLSLIAKIMMIDCFALFALIMLLVAANELIVSPVLAIVALLGSAIAFLLRVLSSYIRRAAVLQEEADLTL